MRRSNRLKQKGVGLWMVAQMVMPVFVRFFTTAITCAGGQPAFSRLWACCTLMITLSIAGIACDCQVYS